MFIGLGLRIALLGSAAFWPSELFINGEPGQLMPVDPAYLYQDTAGTQPVTAPAQAVALQLDQSKGLVLGPELVTNGTFDTGISGWSSGLGSPTLSWVPSNAMRITRTVAPVNYSVVSQTISGLTVGKRYNVTSTFNNVGSGTNPYLAINGVAVGTDRLSFVATATSHTLEVNTTTGAIGTSFDVDNISVKELPGNHDTQATVGSRPIYGKHPANGYRNMLASSEDFSAAAWGKVSCTVGSNAATAPDGTTTAEKLIPSNAVTMSTSAASGTPLTAPNGITSGATYAYSIYAKAAEFNRIELFISDGVTGGNVVFDLSSGSAVSQSNATGVISSAENGWWRCTLSRTASGTTAGGTGTLSSVRLSARDATATTGNGTSGILIWGAQLETDSTATTYQRTDASSGVAWPAPPSYDITEAGQPDLHYLHYNGVSSFMVSPTITPGIDKAQVFVGVRKLSDAATGALLESSVDAGSNAGTILLLAPDANASPRYGFYSRGSVASGVASSPSSSFAAPISNVVTGIGDISADVRTIRINASSIGTSSSDQGMGNFLAYPIYTGRRGGTSLPFNGLVYSKIIRFGANLTADQIASTERWTAQRTGVAI